MTELTLATANLHWGVERSRPVRDYDVLAAVRSLAADVMVLPESWRPHDAPSFLDALVGDGYHVEELAMATFRLRPRPAAEDPGEGWWELAVASRFPVRSRTELPLGRVLGDPVGERRALVLDLDVDAVPLRLVALHASSRLWVGGPVVHLRHLRAGIDRLPVAPDVVAGDCNLWGPAVARLLPGWQRTVRGRTYPAHRPHSQIDHVLVDGRVDYLGGAVVGPFGSDHRALRVRLRVT